MKAVAVKNLILSLIFVVSVPACSSDPEAATPETISSVADVNIMDGMNVFRRHAVPSEEMFHYYGKVLGFDQLGTYQLGNGGVTRFRVGASELKFTGQEEGRNYVGGAVESATGFRLLTFFYPDEQSVIDRFIADDLPAPVFSAVNGRASALVQDPDGQWVELVVVPGQPEAFYLQIEAGLFVENMDASREFYAGFLGLEELPDSWDERYQTQRYAFKRGNTTLSLRELGSGITAAADTGSGGIQYVVSDAPAVDRLASSLNVSVDQPLYILDGFNMYFLWLEDPDGITNYFAQGNAVPAEDE